MKYLTVKHVLAIHARSIEQFGGDPTIRDLGMLESAVAQPRASFGGQRLYPKLADQAAAPAFSLVMNHPFADGNKRTGYGAMMRFLSRNGHTLAGPLSEH
jgi:death-on-curing protein